MIIEIKSISDALLFSVEAADIREALEKAVAAGANLDGANLYGANLVGASLVRANLIGANLYGANLVRANLIGANLIGANLVGASLVRANLDGANLDGANLDGASLDGATGIAPWLDVFRADLRAVLDLAPNEVAGLADALVRGAVDGSVYTGQCACLLGTIANVRGCAVDNVGIPQDSSRPAEQWFLRISPGLTPSNSIDAAMALAWIREWQFDRAASAAKGGGQ